MENLLNTTLREKLSQYKHGNLIAYKAQWKFAFYINLNSKKSNAYPPSLVNKQEQEILLKQNCYIVDYLRQFISSLASSQLTTWSQRL